MEYETIKRKVESYISQHQMVQQGDCVVVGVSGGADSLCLLWMLKEFQVVWNLTLVAVHVHHGIREQGADEDEVYVKELCQKWHIPCECIHVEVPQLAKEKNLTLEEAGRVARYDAFSNVLEQYFNGKSGKIAVAHHMDDNAETILMNLFRGSGLKGISGIEPVRDNIIRPLLCLRRTEIEEVLQEHNIAWCVDITNLETEYTRNKVRHCILPAICEVFPQATEHILQTGQIAAKADGILTKLAYRFIEKNAILSYNRIALKRELFLQEEKALQEVIVRQALLQVGAGLKDISNRHIEEICLLAQKSVGKSIQLPGKWQAKNGYETLEICEKIWHNEIPKKNWKMEITTCSKERFCEKNKKFPENEYTKLFDYDTIKSGVILRTRKTGDRIQVNPNGSKKLKDYMIDAKIPKDIRDEIPVVAVGNQILWVVGYRMSEAFKVTSQTKTIMQISLVCDDDNL